jgi:TolB-like protein/tetratricopeptide (TPR) repeat protein
MESQPTRFAVFMAEVKRRHVARVALLYLGTAVVIIEAADLILPTLELQHLYDAVVILALTGFPVALVLAWVFDVTPGGVARTEGLTGQEVVRKHARPTWMSVLTLAFTLVAAVLVSWYAIQRVSRSPGGDAGAPGPGTTRFAEAPALDETLPIVAVLPLEDFSEDEAGAQFAAGMHEELVARFSRIPNVRLISRTSVMLFRDSDLPLPQIADSLGATHVVEGSVVRTESQIRVTVQVIDAASDTHLWAGSFTRPVTDVIAVQEEIAEAVVQELLTSMGQGAPGGRGGRRGGTSVPEARDLFVQAMTIRGSGDPDRYARTIPLLTQAVQLDSTFARGWSALAMAYLRQGITGTSGDTDALGRSAEAAQRALLLDPEDAAAQTVTAVLNHRLHRNLALSEEMFRNALESGRSDSSTLLWYALLLVETGRGESAVEYALEAERVAAGDLDVQVTAAQVLTLARRFEEAELKLLDARDRNPGSLDTYRALESLYLALGDYGSAVSQRMELIRRRPVDTGRTEDLRYLRRSYEADGPSGYWEYRLRKLEEARGAGEPYSVIELAQVRVGLGDRDGALDLLEGWNPGDGGLPLLGSNPAWDPLRMEPRFQALLAQMQGQAPS